jgi:hypothetical protein
MKLTFRGEPVTWKDGLAVLALAVAGWLFVWLSFGL